MNPVKRATPVTTLFVDIGGVLLTDGWDQRERRSAAAAFKLAWTEMEERHRLVFDTYEVGKLTLDRYLDLVVFHRRRSFTRAEFRRFILAQTKPYPRMIDLVTRLRACHGLKVVVVSNEARELNSYRVRKFKLTRFVDLFVSSCIVHLRKPDPEIFRLALDLAQVPARQVVYIDNTAMFVEIAGALGIRSILHTSYGATRAELESLGLSLSRRLGD